MAGTYKLEPNAPDTDDTVRMPRTFYVPVFEKMLADSTIVEYEISRETFHTTDSCGMHSGSVMQHLVYG
jgi:hypothetical protein